MKKSKFSDIQTFVILKEIEVCGAVGLVCC
jgi:hypothetical protein